MSRPAYALLLTLLIVIAFAQLGTLVRVMDIYRAQQSDNQSLKALHEVYTTMKADNARLKQDLLETSEAMEQAVLKGARVSEENEALKAQLEVRRKANLL